MEALTSVTGTSLADMDNPTEVAEYVLRGLKEVVQEYDSDNKAEAIEFAVKLKPAVENLRQDSERLYKSSQLSADNHQRSLERVSIVIGSIEAHQQKLVAEIAASREVLARSESEARSDMDSIAERQREADKLKAEIAEIKSRYKEAATWSWVPGYGQYLAGRALVDTIEGKIGRLERAADEIRSLQQQNRKSAESLKVQKKALNNLQTEIDQSETEDRVLEKQQRAFEAQSKVHAKRIASMMNIVQFYRDLDLGLENLSKNLPKVRRLNAKLDQLVTYYDANDTPSEMTLRQAIRTLAIDSVNYRPAKGQNVHQVSFGFNDKPLGSFWQTGKKEWTERDASTRKNTYKFAETARDEWSVYLHDKSRNVSLQLDLWTNIVYYSDANTARREQYQIMDASSRVTGWLALIVEFGQSDKELGSFVEIGNGKWSETSNANGGKQVFEFQETHRDAWSVYLNDTSRKVSIQLDLWTQIVYYSDANSERRSLYQILGAS